MAIETLFINGFYWEQTPYENYRTERLDADITYRLFGYEDETFHVTAELGQVVTFHRDLTSISGTGSISGTVYDYVTGTELGEVVVAIAGKTAITNIYGDYLINDIPVGVHNLTFTKNGYNYEMIEVTITKDTLTTKNIMMVPAGLQVSNGDQIIITFNLKNTGSITTNYYNYFVFETPGEFFIIYGPLRQELTPGETKTISEILTLSGFIIGKTYSLSVLVTYPDNVILVSDGIDNVFEVV